MTDYPTQAIIVLAGTGKPDEQYLDQWRASPLSYRRGQAVDESWHTDHHETIIQGTNPESMFLRASYLLLHYDFYPPDVLTHVSDFSRKGRPMHVGDRIVQRIRSIFPLIEGLTMNEVVEVINEASRAGFTYVTTESHAEMGEWSALVERVEEGVKLTIHAISRTRPEFPDWLRGYARRAQQSAHKRGIEYFTKTLQY
jgi:uncharacterized protein (UPF0548 family)